VLLAACLKTGALVGKATVKEANLLYDFGLYIGLAFQLKDDWLDVYSNPDVFGKKNGGDIIVNKKTFLLIKAMELAGKEQKNELVKWISKKEFDEVEKVNVIKNIYNQLNIGDLTLEKAHFFSEKAFVNLDQVKLSNEQKEPLIELGHTLLNRNK
jgi:geranylgeranyl diphosphate synthase type II